MMTIKLCEGCKRLPYEDIHFDYTINMMTFRIYCPYCGMTSMSYMNKEDAILDWNKRCEAK